MKRKNSNDRFGRFWGLLGRMPGSAGEETKRELVRQFSGGRTESLRELRRTDPDSYIRMLHWMEDTARGAMERRGGETDRLRKGAIAAICGWLDMRGERFGDRKAKTSYAISIACRAAGAERMNDIPEAALRRIYAFFAKAAAAGEKEAARMEEDMRRAYSGNEMKIRTNEKS